MKTDRDDVKGLLWAEWVAVGYALLTSVFVVVFWGRLHDPALLLWGRAQALLMTAALWGVYRLVPCRLMLLVRVVAQLAYLGWWYPDTFELNRIFPNLDHVFASWEQAVFGFQPALTFCQSWPQTVVSELLALGYVSYYPMMVAVVLFYFFRRYDRFLHTSFVVLASFFVFYVVFICLPVAGPQFYYQAVGVDQIAAGHFPPIGDYFNHISFDVTDHETLALPIPGGDGLFHRLLIDAHNAGERPTAAFPSSHVGVTTVLMFLAWKSRSRWLFFTLLPLAVLMFFATFYIQAHYVIDAFAGLVAGCLLYFAASKLCGN